MMNAIGNFLYIDVPGIVLLLFQKLAEYAAGNSDAAEA